MKFILLTMFISLSVWSSNGTGGSYGGSGLVTWQEVAADSNLKPVFKKFYIEGHLVPFHELCIMGERVRTRTKKLVSNPLKLSLGFSVPMFERDYLVQDKVYTTEVCVQTLMFSCQEWSEKEIKIPNQMEVPVLQRTSPRKWESNFKMIYKLPVCEE